MSRKLSFTPPPLTPQELKREEYKERRVACLEECNFLNTECLKDIDLIVRDANDDKTIERHIEIETIIGTLVDIFLEQSKLIEQRLKIPYKNNVAEEEINKQLDDSLEFFQKKIDALKATDEMKTFLLIAAENESDSEGSATEIEESETYFVKRSRIEPCGNPAVATSNQLNQSKKFQEK